MLEAFLRHQVSSSPLRFEGDVSSPQLGSARGAGVTELAALCERLARERLEKPIAMRPVTTTGEHRSIYALPPLPTARMLDLDQRLALCLKVAANPTECIEIDELRQLLRTCPNPVAYDGFGGCVCVCVYACLSIPWFFFVYALLLSIPWFFVYLWSIPSIYGLFHGPLSIYVLRLSILCFVNFIQSHRAACTWLKACSRR